MQCSLRIPLPPGDDGWAVATAADRLGLTEKELFETAHRRWFGAPAPASQLNVLLGAYLLRREVPFWVRDLARDVLARPAPAVRVVPVADLVLLTGLLAAAGALLGL